MNRLTLPVFIIIAVTLTCVAVFNNEISAPETAVTDHTTSLAHASNNTVSMDNSSIAFTPEATKAFHLTTPDYPESQPVKVIENDRLFNDEDITDDTEHASNVDVTKALTVDGYIVSAAIKHGEVTEATLSTPTGDDYDFPEVVETDAGIVLSIPDAPVPSRSSRRLLKEGNGAYVSIGSTVNLTYDMFSWSTGKLVDSSRFASGEPFIYTLGSRQNPMEIPNALQKAISGRTSGSRVQIILEQGEEGLSSYFNPNDGYVLIVDIN